MSGSSKSTIYFDCLTQHTAEFFNSLRLLKQGAEHFSADIFFASLFIGQNTFRRRKNSGTQSIIYGFYISDINIHPTGRFTDPFDFLDDVMLVVGILQVYSKNTLFSILINL